MKWQKDIKSGSHKKSQRTPENRKKVISENTVFILNSIEVDEVKGGTGKARSPE